MHAMCRYRELLLAGASAVHGERDAFSVALWVLSESLAQVLQYLKPHYI